MLLAQVQVNDFHHFYTKSFFVKMMFIQENPLILQQIKVLMKTYCLFFFPTNVFLNIKRRDCFCI